MADWYVSSAAYAAIAAFIPSHTYVLGDICKPTAPALKAQWVFRCTTAGTASTEPAWNIANNGTSTSGGATFTNVTGQSAYGWSAAAGDIPTLLAGTPRFVAGDRIFVSSDHAETQTTITDYGSGQNAGASYTSGQVLSVNRAGSVPPVAADLLAGATCTVSSANLFLDANFPVYHFGLNYVSSGASGIYFAATGSKTTYLDGCQLFLSGAATGAKITANAAFCVVLNNSTLRFSHVAQSVTCVSGPIEWVWLNTPSALAGAIFPTTQLFSTGSNTSDLLVTMRGVDISAMTAGSIVFNGGSRAPAKLLLDSCKIASGITRYNNGSVSIQNDLVELVNCYDGTGFLSESWQPAGGVTTELMITLSGGAQDNVGSFAHKMVSNTNVDKYVGPLAGFWIDVNYGTTGSAKTATVEIISSASLNNDEISLLLEYEGTVGSSIASFVASLPATVLTAASAVTTSTATWNSSPATPVKQKLQVTFTPRTAGRVRAQVRLGKASTTVWYDPRVVIT